MPDDPLTPDPIAPPRWTAEQFDDAAYKREQEALKLDRCIGVGREEEFRLKAKLVRADASMLRQAAADARGREGQTCETCRFQTYTYAPDVSCEEPRMVSASYHTLTFHLEGVKPSEFSCTGWTAKPETTTHET